MNSIKNQQSVKITLTRPGINIDEELEIGTFFQGVVIGDNELRCIASSTLIADIVYWDSKIAIVHKKEIWQRAFIQPSSNDDL